ncbi:MAG: potassium-transporting ATPase subunit KdpC [Anaerolineae bacterium]|nr:potassium-transporting ATPase subunit KdpC [Anaerolineae bacterium]
MKHLRAALTAFVLLTLLTGVVYPLSITAIGQLLFPVQANGSLIIRDGQIVGSSLVGQTTDAPAYFWGRPSAVNVMQGSSGAVIASGATNSGWTSVTLAEQVAARGAALRAAHGLSADETIPAELLFASASGIDPHISPEGAALQIDRVAAARGLDRARVEALVAEHTEMPQFGFLGMPRVNVLLLNLALDSIE